jgi:hypothetical protein
MDAIEPAQRPHFYHGARFRRRYRVVLANDHARTVNAASPVEHGPFKYTVPVASMWTRITSPVSSSLTTWISDPPRRLSRNAVRSRYSTGRGVSWCSVDARGQVVWFVGERGLHTFDLVDRRIRPIVAADLADLEIIIDWDTEKLGGEDPLEFDVAAALRMSGVPSSTTVIGCEGDRAEYCFEEDGTTPTAELAQMPSRKPVVPRKRCTEEPKDCGH